MLNDQKILADLHALPPEQQAEVVDFIAHLRLKAASRPKIVKSLQGLWKPFGPAPDEQEIQSNREEMFRNWPAGDL